MTIKKFYVKLSLCDENKYCKNKRISADDNQGIAKSN